MAITFVDGSASIGTTEFFLMSNSTTQVAQTTRAVVQPFVDLSAMIAGDRYQLTVYEKVNAGTQRVAYQSIVEGAQASLWVAPALILGDGWEVGVKRLAGADRTIAWSVRRTA